jgi:hypothetical protein
MGQGNPRRRAVADPDHVDFFVDALAILARAHPNLLLAGPVAEIGAALEVASPYLRQPVASWTPREASEPLRACRGTVVIRAIETADAAQQSQLCAWLDECAGTVQVVSTTTLPLFPLVTAGAFLERLYYGLNHLYFYLRSGVQAR